MNNFSQIIWQLLRIADTSTSSSHFGGTTPFKVQVNFDIPVFEGHIDADALEKWVNLLEGYFSVYNFSNRENTTFALLKVVPHVKDWWETYCEQTSSEEYERFGTEPTWEYFVDTLKGNITLSKTMKTNTWDGTHSDTKGTKQCQRSPISSTPSTQSWVLETSSGIWF